MQRLAAVLVCLSLAALGGCFISVDEDDDRCVVGVDQTCSELARFGTRAGTCRADGTCVCHPGFIVSSTSGRCVAAGAAGGSSGIGGGSNGFAGGSSGFAGGSNGFAGGSSGFAGGSSGFAGGSSSCDGCRTSNGVCQLRGTARQNEFVCGSNGAMCAPCSGATPSCLMGRCVAGDAGWGAAGGSATCDGCFTSNGACQVRGSARQNEFICGSNGAACVACGGATPSCFMGSCVAGDAGWGAAGGSATCDGCLAPNGTCQPRGSSRQSDSICGSNGAACMACGGATPTCFMGACVPIDAGCRQ